MKGGRSLEARLAALSALRDGGGDQARDALGAALGTRTPLVVARAAEVAASMGLVAVLPQLEGALERYLALPAEKDRRCLAKQALVAACDDLDSRQSDLFLSAAQCVQLEKAWGGPQDTAAGVRSRALFALMRLRDGEAMNVAARLLADSASGARAGAARALANSSPLTAVPLLRHKAHCGDEDGLVTHEVFSSLLLLEPEESLDFVAGFLNSPDVVLGDTAALALGESRLEPACDVLVRWARSLPGRRVQVAYAALASLRLPRAVDALLDVIRAAPVERALLAVAALQPFGHDELLVQRVRTAAQERPDVSEACDAAFGAAGTI